MVSSTTHPVFPPLSFFPYIKTCITFFPEGIRTGAPFVIFYFSGWLADYLSFLFFPFLFFPTVLYLRAFL